MMFYGLPIHIMRDLFMTARSFVSRLSALMRYRKALQDMSKYPDATEEELGREDTCIICREEMRPWDPSAVGAVERSRPKKLPCGHILHFGCLKSWLERQQVCPTCRRSVTIDGTTPNGAAQGGNFGGQANAPGQPAPGNRAANAGQPAQARGGGNMRVFQFGPIRLGFAQGNAQNIHEMAQRLRLPLDGANVNVPAAPAQPIQAPQAPATHADNNHLSNIMEMQAQLQGISHRIQQEIQTLQTNQAEVQTLYALAAELNRIRQTHQESQAIPMAQPGQPGVNVQFASYQPAVPHQPFSPFQPMTMAPFAGFPPRAPTPTLTRHGGTSYSAAIPAGSPELPEGVVIPPGWSLLPLQRLDNQPPQPPVGTQQSAQQIDPIGQPPQTADASNETVAISSAASIPRLSNSRPMQFSRHMRVPSDGQEEGTTQRAPERQSEPPVVAPTPVVPNWGGTAQLFANGGAGSSTSPNESETKNEEASTAEGLQSQVSDGEQEEPTSSDAKGKAKAVTVEDAEDE